MPKDNTTITGIPNANQHQNSLNSGAVAAIVISTLLVLTAVVMVSWYVLHRKQRGRVTLTMRRALRIKRLDALHIDVAYSNTILDSPTTDRLSTGYPNLSSDISLDQDLQTQNLENSQNSCDHTPSGEHEVIDLTDPDFCTSLNEIKDRDTIISNSLPKAFDDSNATTNCVSEEQSINDEIKLVPPVRFDFETSSTHSSEIEIALAVLKHEEMNMKHSRSNDNSFGCLNNDDDERVDFSVREKNNDKIDETKVDENDRESLIERHNVISFDNQGLEVTD